MENQGATGSPGYSSVEHNNHARPYSSLSAGAEGSWERTLPSSPSPSRGVSSGSPLLTLRPFPPKIPDAASNTRMYARSNSLPSDSLQANASRPLSTSPLSGFHGNKRRSLTDVPNLTLLKPLPRGQADGADARAERGGLLSPSPLLESPGVQQQLHQQQHTENFHGDKRTSDVLETGTDARPNGAVAQPTEAASRRTLGTSAAAHVDDTSSNHTHTDANNNAASTRADSTGRENYTFQRQEEQFSQGGRTARGPEVDPYVPSAGNMREVTPLQEQGINGYGTDRLQQSSSGRLRELDLANDPLVVEQHVMVCVVFFLYFFLSCACMLACACV
jgi:hypothetical protein